MKSAALALLACLPAFGQFTVPQHTAAPVACVDGPTTSLVARYDSLTLAPCSGGTVSTWADTSGNNNTATGVNGPTCVASEFGASPGVLFNGGSAQKFNLASGISFGSGMTVMAVWKPVTVSAKMDIFGGTGFSFLYSATEGSPIQGADSESAVALGTGTATASAGSIYQTNVTYIGSAAPTFRHNKAADATQNGQTGAVSAPSSVLGSSGTGEYLNAYVGAIYIFSPSLTTTQIQAWESTLSCKYPGA